MGAYTGFVIMIIIGVASITIGFMLCKNKAAKKPRDQRMAEMYKEYEARMKEFKK